MSVSPGDNRGGSVERPQAAEAAQRLGLVTYRTSPLEHNSPAPLVISFATYVAAERRVKNLRRSVWATGHLHGIADVGFRPPVCHFVTLTYEGVNDWRPDHISGATEQYRRYCARLKVRCRYIWVAELQQRGAVHYHLLAWLPVGVRMPFWDKRVGKRKAFWTHGMTNTQPAKSGIGYLMKYLSKLGELTVFPPNLRLHGCGGLDPAARAVRSWYSLPEWAKREYGVGELKRLSGRIIVRATGEILPPMFRRRFIPFGLQLEPLRPFPPRWHDGAYSTFPSPIPASLGVTP